MGRRDKKISRSIVSAISDGRLDERKSLRQLLPTIRSFFYIYGLVLVKVKPDLFEDLRTETWNVSEDDYKSSFPSEDALKAKGDIGGYSGSTFFNTKDNKYLIKSIPRQFEHSFFRDDLLAPYVSHMESHPTSLLVRIADFLAWYHKSLGGILGFAPTYHLIMENVLYGQEEDSEWETFDLKPDSYFFPERDIAGGRLASEATKSKLADTLDKKLLLSRRDADDFLSQLGKDTELLKEQNAVDYSLMLVRIPKESHSSHGDNPFQDPPNWRMGIPSQDGKYLFRAVVLDFFWAKHKTHAKMMTLLIKAWNLIDRKGPMSITTTAPEYQSRFLRMCREMIEVKDNAEDLDG